MSNSRVIPAAALSSATLDKLFTHIAPISQYTIIGYYSWVGGDAPMLGR